MITLILGTVLALAALAFVLFPLFRESRVVPVSGSAARPHGEAHAAQAIAALREVEFDRETGKLSDADYATLKATYTREALAALRAEEAPSAAVTDAEIEAMILAYRASAPRCETFGPRPEGDAAYCSSCGCFLAGACGRCGAAVTEPGARFCPGCGSQLAA